MPQYHDTCNVGWHWSVVWRCGDDSHNKQSCWGCSKSTGRPSGTIHSFLNRVSWRLQHRPVFIGSKFQTGLAPFIDQLVYWRNVQWSTRHSIVPFEGTMNCKIILRRSLPTVPVKEAVIPVYLNNLPPDTNHWSQWEMQISLPWWLCVSNCVTPCKHGVFTDIQTVPVCDWSFEWRSNGTWSVSSSSRK
jgi:hypothetical protein